VGCNVLVIRGPRAVGQDRQTTHIRSNSHLSNRSLISPFYATRKTDDAKNTVEGQGTAEPLPAIAALRAPE
jgi:hypothetical protein